MAAEPAAPPAPPNLRLASDEAKECDTCTYFDHTHCTAYPPLCVDSEWTCDHWKASGKPDEDAQPKTMSEAGDEARKRLRAAK